MVSNNEAASRKRILIVDDDPSIRYMLSRVLADEGYEARSAADGAEGLKAVADQGFDLMLLDLKMPKMNGQEAFKQLRLLHPGMPVIMMTAFPGQLRKGEAAGDVVCLQKPLDFPVLLDEIKRLLARAAAGTGPDFAVRKV